MARRPLRRSSTFWLTLVALLVIVVGVLWPLLPAGEGDASGPDPVRITSYEVELEVDADGDLAAVERVTADFPSGRHGIFRFWDVTDPAHPGVRLDPDDIEVTLDGGTVPVELMQEGPRYRVAKVGDPDSTLPAGSHTYTIRYTVEGVLRPADGGAVLAWDVVPGGWRMAMDRSAVSVTLPEEPVEPSCAAGAATAYDCEVAVDGSTVTVSTGALPPNTPVTLRAGLPTATSDRATLPWSVRWDPVLGRSVTAAAVYAALAVVGLGVGLAWARRAREPEPGFPVLYAPPDGMGPVQAEFIRTERLPGHGLVATFLHLAERGLVRLERSGDDDWVVTGQGDKQAWSQVDPVSRAVGKAVGVSKLGKSFEADGSVEAGKRLGEAQGRLDARTRAWAFDKGLLARHRSEAVGTWLVVGAAVIAIAVFVFALPCTLAGLPFAAFALGGVGLVRSGVGTRRTEKGRQAWSRAGGFHRLLSTPSAQDRFDFSGRQELYTAYIPYAVAFDCAEEWARKYRASTGQTPPDPVWYPVGAGGHGFSGATGFESFESSLTGSISAYEATQSSSSSGGGGGVGGGGGGGGGSW